MIIIKGMIWGVKIKQFTERHQQNIGLKIVVTFILIDRLLRRGEPESCLAYGEVLERNGKRSRGRAHKVVD